LRQAEHGKWGAYSAVTGKSTGKSSEASTPVSAGSDGAGTGSESLFQVPRLPASCRPR
jgi:hypothetical protein